MNFPGLDFTWTQTHRALQKLGVIEPWSLTQCRLALEAGERVLVVASTALGDSLLTLPLIESLSEALGPERVGLLVREPYRELYANDPRIGHVFTVRKKHRGVEALKSALRATPHRIALLANVTEPDLIPWLWWSGVRGFLRYRSRWTCYPQWIANGEMLRRPGEIDYATGHAIENNLAMAEALAISPSTHHLRLPRVKGLDSGEKKWDLLVHPGASRQIKQWPPGRWAELIQRWWKRGGGNVGLTGSVSELPLCEAICRELAETRNPIEIVAGKLSLVQLAQTQRSAQLFLSGDTGPYHLAVAVGCPTVTVFAPTDRGSSREACGPHQADPLKHRSLETAQFSDTIDSISVDAVWAEIEQLSIPSRGLS